MKDLAHWRPRAEPSLAPLEGRFARLEAAIFPGAARELFPAIGGPANAELWTHIPIGPFDSAEALGETMGAVAGAHNWKTYLIRDAKTGAPLGMASYMRIRPADGSIEVGCIVYSKDLQRTPAATETMYLMMRHVFDDLGYRRYEWKCNYENAASKAAAERLGFKFEGVFRQDMVMKGRNRDTAWYSVIDGEWPALRAAFEAWLAPENFDDAGKQRCSLREMRAAPA